MHNAVCRYNFRGLCSKMDPMDGEELLGYLRKVNFTGKLLNNLSNELIASIEPNFI